MSYAPSDAPSINFRSLTLNSSNFGPGAINIGAVLPANSQVLDVSVYVSVAFDLTATVRIDVGPDILLDAANINLSSDGETFIGTDQAPDSALQLTANTTGAPGSGAATIVVRFAVIS